MIARSPIEAPPGATASATRAWRISRRPIPRRARATRSPTEDLIYYSYGLLHYPDYRSRYADNLGNELPRIPAVKRFADFAAFSKVGRDLAHWHLNYETVAPYEGVTIEGSAGTLARSAGSKQRTGVSALLSALKPEHVRVEKMKFAKTRDPATNKSINDKTTVF